MLAKNSNRLSLAEFFERRARPPVEVIGMILDGDKPGPALCTEGCAVDLYGVCPHSCPSVLLTLVQYGYIWGDILSSKI
jgi:hypothetical protein